ncbi:MAG: indole-3-glycerol phosphate synthase TrpC [Bacteroidia bacterium]|nr:indole-3-glycerol phosphate synthase TrpC [Bacteroidia bacterium]
MADILKEIIDFKRKEVEERKSLYPVNLLERSVHFHAPTVSLSHYLTRTGSHGIIAEFKRKSPSGGAINIHADVERTSIGYMMAGASALSILTDQHFFGGSNKDLACARKYNYCPVLRKDFIIDEYQVLESRSIGSDAILLIASVLSPTEVKKLGGLARSLGMEVLLEIHNEKETGYVCDEVNLVGVNNRNLKKMSVSLEVSESLIPRLPQDRPRISESGIKSVEDVIRLRKAGFNGFLMGEFFMRFGRPEKACERFIQTLSEA